MNPKGKGEKAQLIVMGEFAKFDIPVLAPLSDNLPFDFVAVIDGKLKKVQVKSSERINSSGAREFSLRTTNWYKGTSKGYTKKDCDLIVCYDHESGDMYLLKPEHFVGTRSWAVRKEKTRNGQTKGLNFHDDFVLTKERLEQI